MTYKEKVEYYFPKDEYFKVNIRFTNKTDPKYSHNQLNFHLGNKEYKYIIKGGELARYLLLTNVHNKVISENGLYLNQELFIGLPLVFINSPFRHYENAVVITKIEEATSTDCEELTEITGITLFGMVRKEDYLGSVNLYSKQAVKSCYELMDKYIKTQPPIKTVALDFLDVEKTTISTISEVNEILDTQQIQFYSPIQLDSNPESKGKALKEISNRLSKFEKNIETNYNIYTINKKEQKNMFGIQDLEFGKYKGTDVKMSIYGPAFTVVGNGHGTWLSFDKNNELIDVTDMLIDNIPLMVMPTSPESLSEGDFIHYTGVWMQVREVDIDGTITAYRLYDRTIQKVLPTKNIFGFNYYTKLITFNFSEGADSDNPFGNLLPLMIFSEGGTNSDNLLPLMLMSNNTSFDFKSNPMLLYMMMSKDSDNTKWLPFMLMNR